MNKFSLLCSNTAYPGNIIGTEAADRLWRLSEQLTGTPFPLTKKRVCLPGIRMSWKPIFTTILLLIIAVIGRTQGMTSAHQPSETADRLAIRELIDAYSHHADRREADKQTALFTQDAVVEIYQSEPGKNKPTAVLHGRSELLNGFLTLKKYDVTMHVNGQNTLTLNGDRATGETYCLAHHIWVEDGKRMLMVMGIRYYDTYVRQAGKWLFAERKLIFDWTDRRPSMP